MMSYRNSKLDYHPTVSSPARGTMYLFLAIVKHLDASVKVPQVVDISRSLLALSWLSFCLLTYLYNLLFLSYCLDSFLP